MIRPRYYRLDGREPVPCAHEEWVAWFESEERRVGWTEIGPWRVSTVFLGLDHNFSRHGPPVLFETAIFGDGSVEHLEFPEYQTRCATWAEAELQHQAAVKEAKAREAHFPASQPPKE